MSCGETPGDGTGRHDRENIFMRNWTYLAAAAVAFVAPQAASAATLVFTNGVADFASQRTVTGTGFVDTYTFTTDQAFNISGQIGSRSLFVAGDLVSDLDFVSVTLNNLVFDFTGSTDIEEAGFLSSSALAAGLNTLTVTYNVDAASTLPAAGYSGTLTLAPSSAVVPEPATWAMMMAGFGIVGAGLRRRRSLTTVSA
jgi:hypothetical protein